MSTHSMDNSSDIAKLRELVDKLKSLLDQPEPGLYMWNLAVVDKIRAISKFGL